eukprot:10094696-Prorocentrum_lima.AAC.1
MTSFAPVSTDTLLTKGTPARVFGCCLFPSPAITLTAVTVAGDDDYDGVAPVSLGRECSNLHLPPSHLPPSL